MFATMPSVALDPAYRRVGIHEFLSLDLGDAKAELVDGVIFMVACGGESHARIAANLIIALGTRLRGSGCRPYGSDFAMRTDEHTIRFPDVSVYCRPADPANDRRQLLGDPQVVFEVLSPSTASNDQRVKLPEYQALTGLREIVLVDPESERVHLYHRTARGGWTGEWLNVGEDVPLPSLDVVIPYTEIFARD
jgi:Uma2 family endonuclease